GMHVAISRMNRLHTALTEQRSTLLADERGWNSWMIATIIRSAWLQGWQFFGNGCRGLRRRCRVRFDFGESDASNARCRSCRRCARRGRFGRKEQFHAAQFQGLSRLQDGLPTDGNRIDERSIGRTEIQHNDVLALETDLTMKAGDRRVINWHIVLFVTP